LGEIAMNITTASVEFTRNIKVAPGTDVYGDFGA